MTTRPDATKLATRRALLRSSTAAAHAGVERVAGEAASLSAYRHYLLGLCAFRIPIEASLASGPWPAFLDGWRPTILESCLRQDLDDLALSLAEAPPADALVPQDVEGWMGILYVLEGSSLGARVIAQRARRLGFGKSFGARHLARQTESSANWRAFLALLETVEPFDAERATHAAIGTFSAAEMAFGMWRP